MNLGKLPIERRSVDPDGPQRIPSAVERGGRVARRIGTDRRAVQDCTPSRIAQALAPLGFGLLIEPLGRGIIVVSSALSLSALIALLLLKARTETAEVAAAAE